MYAYIYTYDNPKRKDRKVKSLSNGNNLSFDLFWVNIYIYVCYISTQNRLKT